MFLFLTLKELFHYCTNKAQELLEESAFLSFFFPFFIWKVELVSRVCCYTFSWMPIMVGGL